MKYKNGITSRNLVVKTGADFFLPFAVIFGLYIILFGTVSPGGGFQGGVMVASAVLLLYLAYGYQTASKAISLNVLRVNESVGATCYVLLGFLGLVLGMRFCQNVIFKGEVGDLLSGGTITFMSWSVGYKVLTGVGFLLLLMLGLLAPGSDADDEEEDDEEVEE